MTYSETASRQAASVEHTHRLLLKVAFTNADAALEHWHDWCRSEDIESLDDFSYSALPMLYRNLRAHGTRVPEIERLRGVYLFHWTRNQIHLRTIESLTQRISELGSEALLIRDAAHLVRGDPSNCVRPIDVLHLLIPPDSVCRLLAELQSAGWTSLIPVHSVDNRLMRAIPGIPLVCHDTGARCDILWAPFSGATWEGAEAPFWRNAIKVPLATVPAKVLGPTEQLLEICARSRLRAGPPIPACVADALAVLRMEVTVDWARLVALAEAYQSTVRVGWVLGYLSTELGRPLPSGLLAQLVQRPTSSAERLQQRLITRTGWLGIDYALRLHWLYHSGSLPGTPTLARLALFPRYLRDAWRWSRRTRDVASQTGAESALAVASERAPRA